MEFYAQWLRKSLAERGYQAEIVWPEPFFSRLMRHPGPKKYLGYLDKFLLFPPRLWWIARGYDLVHVVDQANAMYLHVVRGRPCLITCHDVLAIRAARGAFPGVSVGWSGKLLQRWIFSGLRAALHVICVSTKTADDLKAITGKKDSDIDIRVILNALNRSFHPGTPLPSSLSSRLGLMSGQSYLLHFGTGWYKNRLGVLRIFAQVLETQAFSTTRLIMVGRPWTAAMRKLARELHLGDRAAVAVNLTDDEVEALLCNALALLFPSLEEGFGWPILEAQACGCPVITSARPPMTEVAGEAAIFVDPTAPRAAAAAIVDGLQRREWLRAAGFRNLERFDEAAIADQYCAFYEDILKAESGPAL